MKRIALLLTALLVLSCGSAPPAQVVDAAHPSGGTAAQEPPAGLAPAEVPQFVQFGFDDNGISGHEGSGTTGGARFVRELFDGRVNPAGSGNLATFDEAAARFSFYVATRYIAAPETDRPEYVRAEWRAVADAGHEIGLHTHNHPHGAGFGIDQWLAEIAACRNWITKPYSGDGDGRSGVGLALDALIGFRTPYLEHGPPLFPALRIAGIEYDCSIQEGFEERFDAGNVYWPYRISPDFGSTGASVRELWEIPAYALVVPPDEDCPSYGIPPGLRDRLHAVQAYFNPEDGKITGFDWNLWVEFGMRPAEVVATFRYTLDQRLAGNRAPLTFGAHSDLYSEQYPAELPTTAEERRQALRDILDHALSRSEVRVVSAQQILEWIRSPVPLR